MDNNSINKNSSSTFASFFDKKSKKEFVFIDNPKKVTANYGVDWFGDAWNIIFQNFFMWFLAVFIFGCIYIIMFAVDFSFFDDSVVSLFMSSLFMAGFIVMCSNQEITGKINLSLLFIGFKKNTGKLLLLGGINVLFGFIVSFINDIAIDLFINSNTYHYYSLLENTSLIVTRILSAIFVIFTTYIYVGMFWFSPALIINHNFSVMDSIKTSCLAFKRNIIPFFVFFIIIGLVSIASIPLYFGFILMPMIFPASYYTTYRVVFFEESNNTATSFQDNNP